MSWDKIHHHYKNQDWSKLPSIFAQEAISYFPIDGSILEIGAGLGQDSRFFHSKGYEVISTDFSTKATEMNHELSLDNINVGRYETRILDVSQGIEFLDERFETVYAHLSLHYFSKEQTISIVRDIYRVLKPGGILAVLLNTYEDSEYGSGEILEDDFFEIGSIKKRYFRTETAEEIFGSLFQIVLLDDAGETYKDSAKGIHNLSDLYDGKHNPLSLVWYGPTLCSVSGGGVGKACTGRGEVIRIPHARVSTGMTLVDYYLA